MNKNDKLIRFEILDVDGHMEVGLLFHAKIEFSKETNMWEATTTNGFSFFGTADYKKQAILNLLSNRLGLGGFDEEE